MSQLTDNLNSIKSIKGGIKSAIEAKGVDMTGMSFQDYPTAIGQISTAFVTETLSVSDNGTYTPGQGIDGYSQVIVDVPQSVTGFTEKDITEGRVTIVNLSNSASYVAADAFKNNYNLLTVSLPNCLSVSAGAFNTCRNLSDVYLPVCKSISNTAFTNCSALTTLSFSECVSIYYQAFLGCSRLTDISIPNCENLGDKAFSNCYVLSSISLPKVSYIQAGTFYNCSALSDVYLPTCRKIGDSAFYSCSTLSSLLLPMVTSVGGIVFQYCKNLSEIDLPVCGQLSGAVTANCSNLETLKIPAVGSVRSWYGNPPIIDCPKLSQLYVGIDYYDVIPQSSLITISNTYFSTGSGSIYVNVNNYSSYIAADGWSSLASLFVSVGDTTDVLLSFSDGLLYGTTKTIMNNVSTFLGIAKNDVTTISLPKCCYIHQSAFTAYNGLSEVYLDNCLHIGSSAFYNCSALTTLTIKTSIVCLLEDVGALRMIPHLDSGGIFVPSSLVDTYKSADNWKSYSIYIHPIPE